MFRLDWYQPQPSGPVRLVVSGELSPAAHEAMLAAVERARREAVTVELDLHDVTRVDRSVVCGLAQLCAQGVSFGRCPAYLERWFREETALSRSRGRVAGPSGAAKDLGMPASTLEWKIIRLGIDKHRFRSRPS